MANIIVEGLRVKFQNKKGVINTALNDLSCQFYHGKISVILGNSGGGKTTLLRSIIGSVLINGKILINGMDVEKMPLEDKNISYVSQDFALYPHMSIYENIAFPLSVLSIDSDEIKERVFAIASIFEIKDLLNRQPKELSIGQKQRVALARALIKRSDIYLFDEPFSNLDKKKADEIKPLLKKALKEIDATVLFVTHEAEDVYLLADYVYIIEDGNLIYQGDIEDARKNNQEKLQSYFKLEDKSEWKI